MKKRIGILMLILSLLLSVQVSAHEYPKPLRWNIVESGKYTMKVNYSKLSSNSPYRSNVSPALGIWNYPSTTLNVRCKYESSFSNSTVDIVTTNDKFWEELVGYNLFYDAVTVCTDTNGYQIIGGAGTTNSNGKIKYAAIYINPNDGIYLTYQSRVYTLGHEIGHAFGIAHAPSSIKSIMVQNAADNPNKLYEHDIYDVLNFYGRP